MKQYELIIERSQPPCGGKDTKVREFSELAVEDPMAYVQQQEPHRTWETSYDTNGDLVISSGSGFQQVRYIFSEL